MYCNTSATLYSYQRDGVYIRKALDGVFWDENGIAVFSRTGVKSENKAFIMIPYQEGLTLIKGKDRIVRGSESPETLVTELIKAGHALLITDENLKKAGSESMWHWEVTAK